MIVLTGASGGIGKDILPMLSKLDDVYAIYHTTQPDITGEGNITYHKLDISSEYAVKQFYHEIKNDLNKITIINAAAISRDRLAAQLSVEEWDQVMGVNLRGDFLITREFLPSMINEKWGRFIHISSVVGMKGVTGTIAYSAAKTGLLGLSRVLACEYARFNITSNVLVLGYFNTGLIETLSEKIEQSILENIPSKKLGNPSNIVNAIAYLIKSDYTNGSVLNIDGAI